MVPVRSASQQLRRRGSVSNGLTMVPCAKSQRPRQSERARTPLPWSVADDGRLSCRQR